MQQPKRNGASLSRRPHADTRGSCRDGLKPIATFSGQGIPSGQLAELRRVARLPAVSEFLLELSSSLSAALSELPVPICDAYFAHGLDLGSWAASSASEGPPISYMNSCSVTLVLTFGIQLACFKYVWAREVHFPALEGAVGHSQGLAAAMVVALTKCERSFVLHACTFGHLLLHLGLAIAKAVPAAESYALAVLNEPHEQVAARIQSSGTKVHLVVRNGAKACTLTGTPDALARFQREFSRGGGPSQGSAATCKVLPVRAPYHCEEMLGAAGDEAMRQMGERAPVVSAAELVRPCWSCVDGSELSASGVGCLRCYLVAALTRWAVDWPAAVRTVSRHRERTNSCAGVLFVDFGPGGGSGCARMTNVVIAEEADEADKGARTPLSWSRAEYFTQRHLVSGPLPQSWLEFIRSDEALLDGIALPPTVATVATAAPATAAAAAIVPAKASAIAPTTAAAVDPAAMAAALLESACTAAPAADGLAPAPAPTPAPQSSSVTDTSPAACPCPAESTDDPCSWPSVLLAARLTHLHELPGLMSLRVGDLTTRAQADRVGLLSVLKAVGVARLSERQALASQVARVPKLVAAVHAARVLSRRPRLDVLVSINVHELPTFILHQLEHVRRHLPPGCAFHIVLNANDEMHSALRRELPHAFEYGETPAASDGARADLEQVSGTRETRVSLDRGADVTDGPPGLGDGLHSAEGLRGRVTVHPQPLNKRRFHGSLLQGIMRNLSYGARRWDFDAFLVLSSRSWFRRPLIWDDLRASRTTTVPGGARRATFRFVEAADGRQAPAFVDVSSSSLGLELAPTSTGKVALQGGSEWGALLRTKLAAKLTPGTILQSPHEGLLLERAACEKALSMLEVEREGELGEDLYRTEGAVEEMALQTIAHHCGLRFAQLSDMGGPAKEMANVDVQSLPLTKTERVEIL